MVEAKQGKRSAYRWEAIPEAIKMLHSNLKPVSKVDLFSSKAERSNSERQNKSHTSGVNTDDGSPKKSAPSPYERIKELPQCPICLKKQGFGVLFLRCPCKLVSYCSKEYQKACWSEHKIVCRQALKVRSDHYVERELLTSGILFAMHLYWTLDLLLIITSSGFVFISE